MSGADAQYSDHDLALTAVSSSLAGYTDHGVAQPAGSSILKSFGSMVGDSQSFPVLGPSPRRSSLSQNKTYKCKEEGCHCAFYDLCNLRRHERLKHGRKPKYNKSVVDLYNVPPELSYTHGGPQQSAYDANPGHASTSSVSESWHVLDDADKDDGVAGLSATHEQDAVFSAVPEHAEGQDYPAATADANAPAVQLKAELDDRDESLGGDDVVLCESDSDN